MGQEEDAAAPIADAAQACTDLMQAVSQSYLPHHLRQHLKTEQKRLETLLAVLKDAQSTRRRAEQKLRFI